MRILRKRNIHRGNFPRKQEFIDGIEDCLRQARFLYPEFYLTLADIPVVFYPKGTTAGRARWIGVSKADDSPVKVWNLEFSVEALTVDWNDMYLDTIPHEVAHIVTRFMFGRKEGNKHGPIWVRIAKELGCNGKRCHYMPLTKSRIRRPTIKQLYITDGGNECVVGPTQHKRLQSGYYNSFTVTRTKEKLYAHNHVGEAA